MTYAVTISGNNVSFSMEAVAYSVSLSQSGLQGVKGDKGDKGDTGALQNNITGAYLGDAMNAQPLIKEMSLWADFQNQTYALGDRSGLTSVVQFADVFDFGRTSAAYAFDAAGVLTEHAVDVPRFDHDPLTGERKGLLIEPQQTNLLTYSSAFDNAAWIKTSTTVTANAIAAPDGTTTADLLVVNSGVSASDKPLQGATIPANAVHTTSGFFKSSGLGAGVRIGSTQSGNGFFAQYNILTGALISASAVGTGTLVDHGIVDYGNGWYFVWASGTITAGSASAAWRVTIIDAAGNTVTGDGTSGIYVWGAQLVTGPYEGSLIKTDATTATRAADLLEVKPAVAGGAINSDEGTLVIEFDAYVLAISSFLMAIHNTSDNRIQLTVGTDSAIGFAVVRDSVVTEPGNIIGTLVEGETTKIAIRYSATEVTACVDGGAVDTSMVAAPIGMNQIRLFSNVAGSGNAAGRLKTFAIIPRALSDAELQAITS